MKVPGAL